VEISEGGLQLMKKSTAINCQNFTLSTLVILILTIKPAHLIADERPLALEEVRTLLVGNTIHGIGSASGWFFAIYYREDGVAKGMSSFNQNVTPIEYQDGAWVISTDKGYCLKWTYWKRGLERCMNVFRLGDDFEVKTVNGVRQSVFEVLEGNPDGL
jgi:hypothetical protein